MLVTLPSGLYIGGTPEQADRMAGSEVLRNRVRVGRAERQMSQQELARAVGVSRQTISSIENGQYTPSALLAFRVAQALDMPVDQVFWLEGGAS
jgi:putative transcriptional regulator